MDAFAADPNVLIVAADDVRLDAPGHWVVMRAMPKSRQVEICVEFAIEAGEHVQRELSCYPGHVVVGRFDFLRIFFQVYTDQRTTIRAHFLVDSAQYC